MRGSYYGALIYTEACLAMYMALFSILMLLRELSSWLLSSNGEHVLSQNIRKLAQIYPSHTWVKFSGRNNYCFTTLPIHTCNLLSSVTRFSHWTAESPETPAPNPSPPITDAYCFGTDIINGSEMWMIDSASGCTGGLLMDLVFKMCFFFVFNNCIHKKHSLAVLWKGFGNKFNV